MAMLFAAGGDEFWRQMYRSEGRGRERKRRKLIFKII
jgi:hypothetical protein